MEKLFGNHDANIFLHRTPHPTIELQWLDFVPSAAYRAVIEELMRLIRQHRPLALIADNRFIRALRPTDLTWSGELVFPVLSELGGRRFAIVESQDAMNRMGVTAMVSTVVPNTQLASHYFSTIEDARAWATAPF